MDDELQTAVRSLNVDRLRETPLCDRCLGRLVAKAAKGLGNLERGRRARLLLDLPPPPSCAVCRGVFDDLDTFARLVGKAAAPWEFDTFLIGTKADPEIVEAEESLWTALAGAPLSEPIKAELNREIGKRVEAALGRPPDFEHPDLVALVDTAFHAVDVTVAPLFLEGRYRKLVRGIPQTRWPCRRCRGRGCERCGGTGKMYPTSVEEVIAAAVMAQSGGTGHALHGMGREDVDARMLGDGRPFVVEIAQPRRRHIDLAAAAAAVNASGTVEVTGLRRTTRDAVVRLKEDRRDKTYRVLVRFETPVEGAKVQKAASSLAGQAIEQETPSRVAHRRARRVRRRHVRQIEVVRADGPTAELRVTAEAGTYIKELVHGDGGRTRPSLAAALGTPAAVLELDVLAVHEREGDGQGDEGVEGADAPEVPQGP